MSEHFDLTVRGFMLISTVRQEDGSFLLFGTPPNHIQVLAYGAHTGRPGYELYALFDPEKMEVRTHDEDKTHLVVREKQALERDNWQVRMDRISDETTKLLAIRPKPSPATQTESPLG